jgi:hypothetical protein
VRSDTFGQPVRTLSLTLKQLVAKEIEQGRTLMAAGEAQV